ncbi:hypothetical protein [Woeseia oceani]|uniref:hypothetical protein n=1 Tax=Woeseia oceani TaxID=1548547 RepID=UPI0012E9B3A9|nr:hypothetical protein [Woeseia oceani]
MTRNNRTQAIFSGHEVSERIKLQAERQIVAAAAKHRAKLDIAAIATDRASDV